jgi:hypothetical protein
MFGINLVTNALKTLAANLAALGQTVAEINTVVRERLNMDEPPVQQLETNGRKRVHAATKD